VVIDNLQQIIDHTTPFLAIITQRHFTHLFAGSMRWDCGCMVSIILTSLADSLLIKTVPSTHSSNEQERK